MNLERRIIINIPKPDRPYPLRWFCSVTRAYADGQGCPADGTDGHLGCGWVSRDPDGAEAILRRMT